MNSRAQTLRGDAELYYIKTRDGIIGVRYRVMLALGVELDAFAAKDSWDAPVEGVGEALHIVSFTLGTH